MPSFDVVSEVDLSEVANAIANLMREVSTRYDFKGSASDVTWDGQQVTINADDDGKLKQLQELLRGHLQRRGIEPGQLDFQTAESAAGQSVRQQVSVKQGIETELSKKIAKEVKGAKMKVQVAIQGDSLRVTGKKRDDLQGAIAFIKGLGLDLPLQFNNFRD